MTHAQAEKRGKPFRIRKQPSLDLSNRDSKDQILMLALLSSEPVSYESGRTRIR